jgi:hypothetical protein
MPIRSADYRGAPPQGRAPDARPSRGRRKAIGRPKVPTEKIAALSQRVPLHAPTSTTYSHRSCGSVFPKLLVLNVHCLIKIAGDFGFRVPYWERPKLARNRWLPIIDSGQIRNAGQLGTSRSRVLCRMAFVGLLSLIRPPRQQERTGLSFACLQERGGAGTGWLACDLAIPAGTYAATLEKTPACQGQKAA